MLKIFKDRTVLSESKPQYEVRHRTQHLKESFQLRISEHLTVSVSASDRVVTELTLSCAAKYASNTNTHIDLIRVGLDDLQKMIDALRVELSEYVIPEK